MGSSSPTTTSLFQLHAPDHLDLNELFGQSIDSSCPQPHLTSLICSNFTAASPSSNHSTASSASSTIANPKRDWFSSLILPTAAAGTNHHEPRSNIDHLSTLSSNHNTIKRHSPHLNISSAFDQYNDQPIPFLCSHPPDQQEIANQETSTAQGFYGAALRLSDVAAALGTKTSLSTSCPSSALPLANLTSLQASNLSSNNIRINDASPKGLGNLNVIEEILNKSPFLKHATNGTVNPSSTSIKATAKGNKRSNGKRSGGVNSHSNKDEFLHRLVQQQEANKHPSNCMIKDDVSARENHIHSERQRRKGMTHLYATLHSLLPEGKPKTDRCSVLTETMKYIRTLRHKLAELNMQKAEVIASMSTPKPAADATTMLKSETKSSDIIKENCDNLEDITTITTGNEGSVTEAVLGVAASPKSFSGHDPESEVNTELSLETASLVEGTSLATANHNTDSEVVVRFFGGDAFITLRTLKRKGIWPGVLQILHDYSVEVMNVTLSSSPESDFHCIHAKVPSSLELNSSELHRILKALLLGQLRVPEPLDL